MEAQEVVQEVMIAAAKKMPGFTYEPGKDSLKGWLLSVTRWKVADQFRKREKAALTPSLSHPMGEGAGRAGEGRGEGGELSDDTARTSTVERVPDSGRLAIDAIWDSEWRENLLRAALERVKQTVNPSHYEMYHLHVVQGLTPRETARALGVSTAAVYLAKHRVGRKVKKEISKLETKFT
jgi:RNA polymerase sigma-70 factor (ECF subfamily)